VRQQVCEVDPVTTTGPMLAVARETRQDERRVAVVPEMVAKLTAVGWSVTVESGAGEGAMHADADYVSAGARIAAGDAVFDGANAVATVQPLAADRARRLAPGTVTLGFLPFAAERELIETCRDGRVTALSMELVPRISRAQSMDALSSQALVAGYRAGLVAAERLPRFFPLLMTAAGTVPPAKVLVLGAGVAGLQAIATTRRLGAVVSAYDVRAAAAEEVRSLGARFVELDLPTLEGAGGYAREMTEERSRLQRELLAPHVAEADALITTAAIPGRQAPLLVTRSMVEGMRPGSVVVDLAAESGGNVEGSVAGEIVNINGVTVWGGRNVPSQMAVHASRLYSTNIVQLLLLMTKDGALTLDFDDEIVTGACVTHDGRVVNERVNEMFAGEAS
jgi:H+-translocating NAD(P) transhydrogenase subunit alpha